MTRRFSSRALFAANALFAHTSFGLGKRCEGVNTTMATTDNMRLPTVWRSSLTQNTRRPMQPPFFELYTRGIRSDEIIIVGTNEFEVDITCKCWLPDRDTGADWTVASELYMRLEWAIMELLIQRKTPSTWDGRTLNEADNIQSLGNVQIIPIRQWTPGQSHMGGVGAETTFTVVVAEEDTI